MDWMAGLGGLKYLPLGPPRFHPAGLDIRETEQF